MNHLSSVFKSLSYIETNLSEDICIHELAAVSGYSTFHFQRFFNHMVGDSVKSYVKKRRITEAAKILSGSNKATIDVAVQVGYQSREAFSRAFKQVYGITPKDAKQLSVSWEVRSVMTPKRLAFEYHRRQYGLQPSIRYQPKRYFVGKSYPMEYGSDFSQIPLVWITWDHFNYWQDIYTLDGVHESVGLFLSAHQEKYEYFIGKEVPSKNFASTHLDIIELPAAWYANFFMGEASTDVFKSAWRYIMEGWYPNSGFKFAFPMALERVRGCYDPVKKRKNILLKCLCL